LLTQKINSDSPASACLLTRRAAGAHVPGFPECVGFRISAWFVQHLPSRSASHFSFRHKILVTPLQSVARSAAGTFIIKDKNWYLVVILRIIMCDYLDKVPAIVGHLQIAREHGKRGGAHGNCCVATAA
jgi:hypothetical protein